MIRLIFTCLFICNIFSGIAFAKDISVFAIDFSQSSYKNLVFETVNSIRGDDTEDVIGLLDIRKRIFVGYFHEGHKIFGDKNAERSLKSQITGEFEVGNSDVGKVNLPIVSSFINEFIQTQYKEGDNVKIYLAGSLIHEGRKFQFQSGFPNDGFLTLNDSDFALISELPKNIKSNVYVVQQSKLPFKEQYKRFSHFLAENKFSGDLVSFSYGKDAQVLSFDEPVTGNLSPLNAVNASRVVNAEQRPICEVEDNVQIVQRAENLGIIVDNLSRANSVGNYVISVGEMKNSGQFIFDEQGKAEFSIKLIPGNTVLEISNCAGILVEHPSDGIDELQDEITVIGISEILAKIIGENIQRVDGSDVVIVDESTGREWVTQVKQGQYSIEIPVSPGRHKFYVEKSFSREKQYFDVQLQEHCSVTSSLSYSGAVGKMNVKASCQSLESLLLSYDGQTYKSQFNGTDETELEFPLTCGTTNGTWRVDQQPMNEFVAQYVLLPDIISSIEGSTKVTITVKNPSRAYGFAKYLVKLGAYESDGELEFDENGVATTELRRLSSGTGTFSLEDCEGSLVQLGTFKVSQMDDDIDVSVLSSQRARIQGKNIQRPDGSNVEIINENTGEKWNVSVVDGVYTIEVDVPPGEQSFTASKPLGDEKYRFKVKTREKCKLADEIIIEGGLALLTVSSDCPSSEMITVEYMGRPPYVENLSENGKVVFQLPMECGEANGTWSSKTVGRKDFSTFYDCTGKFRIILSWDKNVDLDLHIAETTDAKFRKENWVYHANCNKNKPDLNCKGIGLLNKDCRGTDCGTQKEEYYVADISKLRNGAKFVTAMVMFYDRDQKTTPDANFCGSKPNAKVQYKYVAYIENKRYVRRGTDEHFRTIDSVPCDAQRRVDAFTNEKEFVVPLD